MGQRWSAGRAEVPRFPVPFELPFGRHDLSRVREVSSAWATLAGLPSARVVDFMIAVNEIATNAVVHGSPAARLLLRVAGESAVEAQVHDRGCWQRKPGTVFPSRPGGMGLPLAHMVCDDVNIQASWDGTTVTLRMNLAGRRHSTGPD
jgi:anti-sigma regulatory factor (Ser/Thr protein kinase)